MLVDRVVEPKNLSSNKLVVPVYNESDLVVVAVLVSCVVDIFEGSPADLVFEEDKLVFGETSPLEMLSNAVCSTVLGGVIDDDDPIVGVVLLSKRIYVPGVAIVLVVHVGGGNDTGMDLVGILVYSMIFAIVLFLFLLDFGQVFSIVDILPCKLLVLQTIKENLISYFPVWVEEPALP